LALNTKQNETCDAFGLWDNLRSLPMESNQASLLLTLKKSVVHMLLTIAVQSLQNFIISMTTIEQSQKKVFAKLLTVEHGAVESFLKANF